MRISEPRIEPVTKKIGRKPSEVSNAVMALLAGQMIEVDPFDEITQQRALMTGKRAGYKMKTRKTEQGTLKIWRLK